MSIEMTPKPRRELILDAVSDLATDLLDYDRKEDESCPAARSRKAIEVGRSRPRKLPAASGISCWGNSGDLHLLRGPVHPWGATQAVEVVRPRSNVARLD